MARHIKHQALTGQKRLIFTVRGKTGEREVVCNETVERYAERLLKLSERRGQNVKPRGTDFLSS